ncbi:MAG: hypothetical protein LBU77_03160, partial [Clostridiales bacterium]|nr:hypothetical protein [Clostridiales bacterium]
MKIYRRLFGGRRGILSRALVFLVVVSLFTSSVGIGAFSVHAASGDVALTSFTVANKADGVYSNSGANFNTYVTQSGQLTVRGTYKLVNAATDALIEIRLESLDGSLDEEGYFNKAPWNGDHHYFTAYESISYPAGSGNHLVTDNGNGSVTVSFTVSGEADSSAEFTIGFLFNGERFGGWIPDGKPIAKITAGGDVVKDAVGGKTLTVTAATSDRNSSATYFNLAPEPNGEIGLGQNIFLDMRARQPVTSAVNWRFEPGTPTKVGIVYPDGAALTVPATSTYGNVAPAPPITNGDGKQ